MTPEELARELEELERFIPPSADPLALLQRDTRIADLQQENTELKQALASRDAEVASLASGLAERKTELAALRISHDSLQRKQQSHDAELRLHGQFWSDSARKERKEKRSQFIQTVSWISLTVASVVIALATVWAGEKYWSYTTDDYAHMVDLANQKNAATNATLGEVRRARDQILRLTHPHPPSPTKPAAKPAADDQNGTPGEAK